MNNTSFEHMLPNENYATLYFDKDTPLPLYGLESFPDGELKISNEDLIKYMLNMIAGQRGETSILFGKNYYDLLFTKTSATYSVFWDVDPGNNAYGHNGGDPGTTTDFHFSGPGNAGLFLLSNYDASTDEREQYYDAVRDQIAFYKKVLTSVFTQSLPYLYIYPFDVPEALQ
jgi:hypothetical protein